MNNFIGVGEFLAMNCSALIFLILGAVLLIGVIMNWESLCDPDFTPSRMRLFYTRKGQRIFIGILSVLLLFISVVDLLGLGMFFFDLWYKFLELFI